MEPKTLEEAMQIIKQKDAQLADITSQRDSAVEKGKKILDEKKDLLKMFNDKEKADMTDNERKLAETLEAERAERIKLEERYKSDSEAKAKADAERSSRALEERITRISKGDTTVADQLRQNVAILGSLPRGTDGEMDALLNTAWNMRGSTEASPFAAINATSGGAPKIDAKPSFSETADGQKMASKLGLTSITKTDNK